MSTWWGESKDMEEIEFSRWLFESRLRQGKNELPDGLNWLCYFAGNSKSHPENSFFLYIFGIPSSSRHEKRCQILQTLFRVFQYSRNSQCFVNLKMLLITELINTSLFGSWAFINPKLAEAINKIPESNSNLCIAPGVCREWLKNFSPNERSEDSSSWNKCFNFWTHLKSKFRMSVITLFSQPRIWILMIVLRKSECKPFSLFAIAFFVKIYLVD